MTTAVNKKKAATSKKAEVPAVLVPTELPTNLALSASLSVMSPEVAKQAVEYLQEIKKSILKRGVDYGKSPGTNKDVLWKPGAQKLCAFFSLTPHYTVDKEQEEFMQEWQYEKWYNQRKTMKTVRGFFTYRIHCELTHRGTGQVWGTGLGSCANTEKGRESNPANTVLKMAQKRAMLQATLDATFSSELFTQDLEDVPTVTSEYDGDQRPPAEPTEQSAPQSEKAASQKQLAYIVRLVAQKQMPNKVSISAEKFMTKKELQSMANAKALIDFLLRCPEKGEADVDQTPPETEPENQTPPVKQKANAAVVKYMKLSKGELVDEIGITAGQLFAGDVSRELAHYKQCVENRTLSVVLLENNNKGQLATLLVDMQSHLEE